MDTAGAVMANYLAGVFAMLAAGYFVAHRLDRTATVLLTVLFTVFCVGLGNELRGLYSDLALVAGQIELRSALPASTLGWHPAAGGAPFHLIPVVVTSMTVAAYVAVLWFFFRARSSGGVGFGGESEGG